MPSPFPGMDPYLESPGIWPDLHDRLAGQISTHLNRTLPKPYYARLEMRPEIGIVGTDESRRIVPDVAIVRPVQPDVVKEDAAVAVLTVPRAEVSTSYQIRIANETLRHHFIEIRDAASGHALITLIEIVSPTNKRRGPDRQAYEAKQQEILDSDTSLIEIDLLREGQSIIGQPALSDRIDDLAPPPDYLVVVNRSWQRGAKLEYDVFPVQLTDALPCIPVPLRQGESEVPLDLQYVFNQAYDGGPYARGAVDYSQPPAPPVSPARAVWLKDCLTRSGARSETPSSPQRSGDPAD